MTYSLFNTVVNVQNKTLTGSWKSIHLFIIVFLVVYAYNYIKNKSMENSELMKIALMFACIAIVMNFITRNLFKSREKLYKTKKGFSSQRARAQAYSNSRMAHLAEEKLLVEKRINDAATTIQKYVRMRI